MRKLLLGMSTESCQQHVAASRPTFFVRSPDTRGAVSQGKEDLFARTVPLLVWSGTCMML